MDRTRRLSHPPRLIVIAILLASGAQSVRSSTADRNVFSHRMISWTSTDTRLQARALYVNHVTSTRMRMRYFVEAPGWRRAILTSTVDARTGTSSATVWHPETGWWVRETVSRPIKAATLQEYFPAVIDWHQQKDATMTVSLATSTGVEFETKVNASVGGDKPSADSARFIEALATSAVFRTCGQGVPREGVELAHFLAALNPEQGAKVASDFALAARAVLECDRSGKAGAERSPYASAKWSETEGPLQKGLEFKEPERAFLGPFGPTYSSDPLREIDISG